MDASQYDRRGFFEAIVDDGRPLLKLTAAALIASGLFAFFLGATGHFLPHDIGFLGMSAAELRSVADSRLVYFMIHDRVSFGGAILGVGVLYFWLVEFPLRARQTWAWWTMVVSGAIGFASFLAYLGYGYLDSWHGAATLVLFPLYGMGLLRSRRLVQPTSCAETPFGRAPSAPENLAYRVGRGLLLVTSLCLVLGGLIILTVGMTSVFVPQDFHYLRISAADIAAVNPRLIPLIAHDRAGFGGGVCCCGATMFFCVYCASPSRSLWQALLITGIAGFGSAIVVHFPIGYTCFTHLAPAYLGAAMFTLGMALTRRRMVQDASV